MYEDDIFESRNEVSLPACTAPFCDQTNRFRQEPFPNPAGSMPHSVRNGALGTLANKKSLK